MKKFSKILSIALLVAMVLSLGITNAFAASIEITHDATYDQYVDPAESTARVYVAYKIFDASYDELAGENTQADKDDFTYEPEDAAVSYSMDPGTAETPNPWVAVMTDDEQTWFDVKLSADGSVYVVTPKDTYTDSAAALAFAEYLQENMPDDVTGTEVTVDGAAANVDPGYYLIIAKDAKDSVTRIALVTTDVTMIEKNTYMDTGKETEETNYIVGEPIEYTAYVTIPSNAALTIADGDGYQDGHGPVILHDKMDAVFAFDASSVAADNADCDFTVVEDPDDDCTFEIVFPITEELLGETITFTFEASLTSDAVNPNTGFINKWYGENNDYQTIPDEPIVWTFDFGFTKVFDDEDDEELTAVFQIRTDADDEDTAIAFTAYADGYVVADETIDDPVTEIEMTNGELVNFTGLSAGTYYLVELETSAGYNLLDAPVAVVITDESEQDADTGAWTIDHSVTVDGEKLDDGVYTFEVENHAGTVLPSTGGIGTTLFYVIGSILVLGAGVVLVAKKRAID